MKQNEINKLKPDRDDRQQRENERSFAPPNHPGGGGRGGGGREWSAGSSLRIVVPIFMLHVAASSLWGQSSLTRISRWLIAPSLPPVRSKVTRGRVGSSTLRPSRFPTPSPRRILRSRITLEKMESSPLQDRQAAIDHRPSRAGAIYQTVEMKILG